MPIRRNNIGVCNGCRHVFKYKDDDITMMQRKSDIIIKFISNVCAGLQKSTQDIALQ